MRRVAWEEFYARVEEHPFVTVEGVKIPIGKVHRPARYGPPEDYRLEAATVWSFPERGDWATHRGNYRGNWSPYIPRNLILKYSSPREWVLDPMVGSGTTLVEARLLNRNAIGVDINLEAVYLTLDRLNFPLPLGQPEPEVLVYQGDARHLDEVGTESIDLIATHPPYWGIIRYGSPAQRQTGDLSAMRDLEDFLMGMEEVAREAFRVLKPGRVCGVLIGDTRRHRHYVPIAYRVFEVFLKAGFILLEDIIKVQHKMKSTRERWGARRFEVYGFHKITHEHLFVFRKPSSPQERRKLWLSGEF